jgi:hypothetical protein
MFRDPIADTIAAFLTEVGIEVVPSALEGETFLPGILVDKGRLLVDETKLTYPGDLLHEAGHLAVAPSSIRPSLTGEVFIPGADMNAVEVQATAWAFAALTHLRLRPEVLFHDGGYRGNSAGLIFTYTNGIYLGAHTLQDIGLTAGGEFARQLGVAPYPHMLKWLRD